MEARVMKKIVLLWMILMSVSLSGFAGPARDINERMTITGEALYWSSHISSLELYAGRSDISEFISDGATTTYMNEYNVDPHFRWDFGHRLSFDCRCYCEELGISSSWTHFHNHGTKDIDEDLLVVNTTKSNIEFDQVDLVLTYQGRPCNGFHLKSILGLRWAKINHRLNANLTTDLEFSPSNVSATLTRLLKDRQNYHGIGPIFGLRADLNVECGFELYGSVTLGLLYGDSRVTFDDSADITAPISKTTFSLDKRHVRSFDLNADLAIGITWNAPIYDCYALQFNLGFEHHQYFNQSRLGVDRGDLTFDGGVFGIKLSF